MREFKGRVIAPGTVTAEAVVSRVGFNTLASFQGALQFGDKKATCGDQNNPDLYNKNKNLQIQGHYSSGQAYTPNLTYSTRLKRTT